MLVSGFDFDTSANQVPVPEDYNSFTTLDLHLQQLQQLQPRSPMLFSLE